MYIMSVCGYGGGYVCAPKSPLNRNSAYRMIQIAFLGSFGDGKRVDLRGRTAGTGARGGKRAKRRGKAGKETLWRRKETNIIKNEAKRGSDGWIRLILGLYCLIEGLEWSSEGV